MSTGSFTHPLLAAMVGMITAATALCGIGRFSSRGVPVLDAGARDNRGSLSGGSMVCDGAPGDCPPPLTAAAGREVLPSLSCGVHEAPRLSSPAFQRLIFRTAGPLSLASYAAKGWVQEIRVANGPAWTHWAVWDKDREALLLTDPPSHKIYHFGLRTGIVKTVVASDLNTGRDLLPYAISETESGYILEDVAAGQLLWLDRSYANTRWLQLRTTGTAASGSIRSVRAWLVASTEIFVLADILDGAQWSERLLSARLPAITAAVSAKEPVEISLTEISSMRQWPLEDRVRQHARLGFPIMATAKGRAFILISGEKSHISEMARDGLRHLPGFPTGYDLFPSIDKDFSGEKLLDAYALIESSSVAVALYGSRDYLFLLLRQPDADGSGAIVWSLARIDPDSGNLVEMIPVPAHTANLLLVPGPTQWAMVEQEKVTGHIAGAKDVTISARVSGFGLVASEFFDRGPSQRSGTSQGRTVRGWHGAP
jgi:hypothetical protein